MVSQVTKQKSHPLLFQHYQKKGGSFSVLEWSVVFSLLEWFLWHHVSNEKRDPGCLGYFLGIIWRLSWNIWKAEWCSASLKVTLSSPNMISCVKSPHKTAPRWFGSPQEGTFDHIHPLASFVEKDAVDVWQHDILPSQKHNFYIFALESSDGGVMMKGEGWYNSLLG